MGKWFSRSILVAVVILTVAAGCVRWVRRLRPDTGTNPPGQVTGTSPSGDPSTPAPPAISDQGPMQLVMVDRAAARGAVCNDGSPAAYYYRRGVGDGIRRWVLHLQGGGFCVSEAACERRDAQEPRRMTSRGLSRTRPGNGIHAASADLNPDFASFNHVFVSYCSSDAWSGDRPASDAIGSLHFRGATILRAVVEDLSDPAITPGPNLADAEQVVFSGTSAGGVGILVHLDWLADRLPDADVRGVNDAGWLIDIDPFDPSRNATRAETQLAFEFWNGMVDETCAAANPGEEGLCYLGEFAYSHIATPLFIQIAQFDAPQLGALGITPNLSQSERQYALEFASEIRASLEPVAAAFSPADRTHGLLTNDKFRTVRIQGSALVDVLGNWVFDRPGTTKLIGQ